MFCFTIVSRGRNSSAEVGVVVCNQLRVAIVWRRVVEHQRGGRIGRRRAGGGPRGRRSRRAVKWPRAGGHGGGGAGGVAWAGSPATLLATAGCVVTSAPLLVVRGPPLRRADSVVTFMRQDIPYACAFPLIYFHYFIRIIKFIRTYV